MALAKNVIENIATNNVYSYNCHKLKEELKVIIEKNNGRDFFIYRRLVEHFGRVISQKKDSFVGELGSESQYTLLEDISKDLFLKVKKGKDMRKMEKLMLLSLLCSQKIIKATENYDKYTALELLQLLDVLERECFPTGGLYKRKNEIIEITAKYLEIKPKEVGWLLTSSRQKQESQREDKMREKQEHYRRRKPGESYCTGNLALLPWPHQ